MLFMLVGNSGGGGGGGGGRMLLSAERCANPGCVCGGKPSGPFARLKYDGSM